MNEHEQFIDNMTVVHADGDKGMSWVELLAAFESGEGPFDKHQKGPRMQTKEVLRHFREL